MKQFFTELARAIGSIFTFLTQQQDALNTAGNQSNRSARQLEKLRLQRDRLKDSAIEMARYALKDKDLERRAKFTRKFEEYCQRLQALD
jgi:hypothetical protein